MKTFSKAVLGSLLLAGAAVATAVPAEARVGLSIGLGVFAPPVVVAPAPPPPAPVYAMPEYCYGPAYYTYCSYPVYGEPVYWNGYWYSNAPYRVIGGRREFWVRGGWHEVEGGFAGRQPL